MMMMPQRPQTTDLDPSPPTATGPAKAAANPQPTAAERRQQRLAAELRRNLIKRKARTRPEGSD
jgi:hypothetical protein